MLDLLKTIINHYGVENQKEKAIEELGELVDAIMMGDRTSVVEEIADVRIMLNQLEIMYKVSNTEVNNITRYKLDRTIKKIIQDTPVCNKKETDKLNDRVRCSCDTCNSVQHRRGSSDKKIKGTVKR